MALGWAPSHPLDERLAETVEVVPHPPRLVGTPPGEFVSAVLGVQQPPLRCYAAGPFPPAGGRIGSSVFRLPSSVSPMKGVMLSVVQGPGCEPITFSMAKQLVPVGNKPILFYGLEDIASAGVKEGRSDRHLPGDR